MYDVQVGRALLIPGGGHSLVEPAMRLTLYTKLAEFLAATLGSP
jgi:hypothetical protein